MFGLRVKEKFDAYLGWRAIMTGGYVDIVPNRGHQAGSSEVMTQLEEWLDSRTPGNHLPTGEPEGAKLKSMTPWKWLLKNAPRLLSGCDDDALEINSPCGLYVLRASTQSSRGYLYIGAFKRPKEKSVDLVTMKVTKTIKYTATLKLEIEDTNPEHLKLAAINQLRDMRPDYVEDHSTTEPMVDYDYLVLGTEVLKPETTEKDAKDRKTID